MSNVREEVEKVVAQAADSLGRTLKRVGWLSHGHMGPIPERNTVVHLASALDQMGYAVFAEAQLQRKAGKTKIEGKRGYQKVDLVAHKKAITLVIEVKAFGRPNPRQLLNDMERLIQFGKRGPSATEFLEEHRRTEGWQPSHDDFWRTSKHLGVIAIQSSRGLVYSQLWRAMMIPGAFEKRLAKYTRYDSKDRQLFRKFRDSLASKHPVVLARPVIEGGHWEKTNPIDLLVVAFTI